MSDSRFSFAGNFPLAATATDDTTTDAAQIDRWVWGFVILGLAARLFRYALCFPLWDDESFLSANLIGRSYAQLAEPLEYHQVAPLLFLWAQKFLTNWLGFSEWTLRLLSLVSGVGSLFLFRYVASKLLRGPALLFAVAIFAVAYPGIRYACEAKPYGSDLGVGLAMLAMAVAWWQRPQQARWLWALTLFAPVATGLSFPAAFVGGGLSLVIGYALRGEGTCRTWLAWWAFNVALLAGFIAFCLTAIAVQHRAENGFMTEFWNDAFPPLANPFSLLYWLVDIHASGALGYPIGGPNWACTLTLLMWLAALATLIRRRAWLFIALCLAPLGLNLAAAALHRYPYAGHVRMVHYTAGPICLLAGLGLAVVVDRIRDVAARVRAQQLALAALAVIALGTMVRDGWRPFKTATDMRMRDFARSFWFNYEAVAEVAGVQTDLQRPCWAAGSWELNWTAMFFCNQEIYSPRRRRHEPIRYDRVSADHPLYCVFYHVSNRRQDAAALNAWVDEMRKRYDLEQRTLMPMPRFTKQENQLVLVDCVELFKFVPRAGYAEPAGVAEAPSSGNTKKR
jgi:hypothetical protein